MNHLKWSFTVLTDPVSKNLCFAHSTLQIMSNNYCTQTLLCENLKSGFGIQIL